MYKKLSKFYLLFFLATFFYMLNGTVAYAADTTKLHGIKENTEGRGLTAEENPIEYQGEIERLKKDIGILRKDLYQSIVEGYNRSCEAVNRLIIFIGVIATIFGIIIALAGIFIGYESIRSRERREEAIRTLEDAKLYTQNKIKEFDKTIEKQVEEINKRSKELVQISLVQLSQDTEKAAKKVKEIEKRGITIEAEKKIELLEKRIKFFEEIGIPDDPKLLYSKAMVLKEKKMSKESLELFKKAVGLDPKYRSAYWEIGWIESELGNYGEAVDAYDKAIELDPKETSAYNNKGVALGKLDRKEEALKCYDKAIELSPKKPMYYTNKADVLEDLERKEEALECYNKAIELNPKKTLYYINKTDVLENLQRYEEGLAVIEKAIGINPDYPGFYTQKGKILNKMGEIKEAIKHYKKASEIEKEKINKLDAGETNWLNYFEDILIVGNYKGATDIKFKMENKIKRIDYLYISDFFSSCLSFLQDNKTNGFKQIFQMIEKLEKNPLEKATSWDFDDINPFLKLRLHKNIYQLCIAVEKMLLKEISPNECKTEIKKLKSKM